MKREDLKNYLNKFVTVTLDDLSKVSGFISNPREVINSRDADLVLLNGLQNSTIPVDRIIDIEESVREETTFIPVVDTEPEIEHTNELDLDEMFTDSINQVLSVDLPDGKTIKSDGTVIRNRKKKNIK